jgi:DNA-directed RNA polymerase III subunit RPC8
MKYANRVIPDVGLCIYLHDFKMVEDAIIYPAEGGAHHRVVCRVVVFRPFVGEIAIGTIVESNEKGIRVSLDFFDEIIIPHELLLQPAKFDQKAKLWVWKYAEGEEGKYQTHEQIRFRVENVRFNQGQQFADGLSHKAFVMGSSSDLGPPPPCMQITASVNVFGLGPLGWSWE